jgi:tRNA nucleotidyltransferase (CCA-adding enzyme)
VPVKAPAANALLTRIKSLPAAAILFERLEGRAGVYLVGGAVRDLLLELAPPDLDLVVDGDATEVAERLGGGRIRRHDRFGTASVELDGHVYDIARSRRETYSAPGALPDVEPASIDEDLSRRDFTVNALAVELAGPNAGALRAVPGALEDLEEHRLRVLHDQSFLDDPTRLLRLVRYSARLGFEVEADTLALARAAIAGGALETVSGARIGAELRLLARERDPVAGFTTLRALELDAALARRFGIVTPELVRRALGLLPADGRADLVVLAGAGMALAPSDLSALLDRLAFEAEDRETIVAASAQAAGLAHGLASVGRPSELAAVVSGAGPELIALAGVLGPEMGARAWLGEHRHVRLEIDGGDLLKAGVAEGPIVGQALRAALTAKLDGHSVGREAELRVALASVG